MASAPRTPECIGIIASAAISCVSPATSCRYNALYDGRYIWNSGRIVTNPDTGRRVRKANDPSLWVQTDVPDLRIVPEELWEKVKARQQAISDKSVLKQTATGERARTGAGPKYLLSGLLTCAECGSNYVVVDSYRYGCARHKDRGLAACSNHLMVDRSVVERAVLEALKHRLLTPAALACFERSLAEEASRQLEEVSSGIGVWRRFSGRLAEWWKASRRGLPRRFCAMS